MAGELAAEWIKIPDGNGNLQKVWVRDSTARREIAQLQADVSGLVIPDPSDAVPQMDGTAAAGSSADYSRADHVHPVDTSRQAALSQVQLDAVNSGITAAKVAAYDAIQVPTATSELTNDSGYITASDIPAIPTASAALPAMDGTASAGSSANWARGDHVHPHDTSKQDALSATQLSAVNSGVTAAKVAEWDAIEVPTKTSDLVNDSGFITSAPVTSVNGQTGAVVLTASDVGAMPDSTTIPTKTSDLTNDSSFITLESTLFGIPTPIPSGADLNDYNTVGHYSAESASIAGNLINSPTATNFSMFVVWRTTTLKSQIIISASTYAFIRYQSSSGWNAWRRISTTAV